MNRKPPTPPPPSTTPPVMLDITVIPLVFEAAALPGSEIASVLVETSGEPFSGTLALSGPDQDKFGITEGALWLVAGVTPGKYEITVIAEQGTESLYSPQI